MDGGEKLIATIVIIIGLTVGSIAWAISFAYVNSWRAVTTNGYVEQPVQTYGGSVWAKPDTGKK